MGMFDDLLKDLDNIADISKEANDNNGSPDNPANQSGSQDIAQIATEFLQSLETFKQQVAQQVGGSLQGDPNQDPNAQNLNQDPNAQNPPLDGSGNQIQDPANTGTGVTIQRPDGSVIKVASLIKLAAIYGKPLFEEVK